MTFVTTSLAVAGLAAIAIPILIHLLSRQRRRPIEWAAMRFLIEAFRRQRRRLRVQQLLLLTVRCLIVLLLGAALARPLLEHTGILATGGGRVVWLVVDNGMIAGLHHDDGESSLQRTVEQGVQIIDALDPGDRVGVVTAARPAAALLAPPSSDHSAVVRLLRDLPPTDAPTDMAGALMALQSALDMDEAESSSQQVAYLLSEFRGGSAGLDAPLPGVLRELDERITLLAAAPAEHSVSNVQIAAIEPVRNMIIPGSVDGSGQVTVRLTRHGQPLDADVSRVRLTGEGVAPIDPRIVRWEPGQSHNSVDFLLNFTTQGEQQLALTAELDDDALNADNTRHAVIDLRNRIRVVMLERRSFGFEARLDRLGGGQWIRRALEPRGEGPLQVIDVEPAALSAADMRTADVVIASRPDLLNDAGWSLLREFVDRGGLLAVTPPGQLNVHQWVDRFVTELDLPWRINLEVSDEAGLFMADEQPRTELLRLISSDLDELVQPVVSDRLLRVDMQQSQATPLLLFADGSPMVIAGSPREGETASESQGLVVMFTVAPELQWTNLPSKPLMVPLMHELVRQGLSSIRGSQRITAGEQPALTAHAAATDMISPDGQRIAVSAARPQQALADAGVYELHDAAAQSIGRVAVNPDPAAGNSDAQPASAVQAWLAGSGQWSMFDLDDPAAALRNTASASPLAAILLLIVLALVILETLLARWFSHSVQGEGPVAAGGLEPTIHSRTSLGTAGGAA